MARSSERKRRRRRRPPRAVAADPHGSDPQRRQQTGDLPKRRRKSRTPAARPGPFTDAERRQVERHGRAERQAERVQGQAERSHERATGQRRSAPQTQPGPYRESERKGNRPTERRARQLRRSRRKSSGPFTDTERSKVEGFKRGRIFRTILDELHEDDGPSLLETIVGVATGGRPVERVDPDEYRRHPERFPGATAGSALGARTFADSTPARAVRATGLAFAADPLGTSKKTGSQAKGAVLGLGQAIGELGAETIKEIDPSREGHPTGVVRKYLEQAVDDYGRRYGDLNKPGGVERGAERIRKEGALPELLDVAAAGAAGGAVVGRGLGAVARATSKPGSRRERLTGDRPDLRVSGGREGVRRQERSPNLFRAAAQEVLDETRRRRHERQVGERPPSVFRAPLPSRRRDIQEQRQDAPRPAIQPGDGEVVPLTQVPFFSHRFGRAARDFAADKATLNLARRSRTRAVLREVEGELGRLTGKERRAFTLALELGLAQGRRGAEQLRDDYRPLVVVNRELAAVNEVLRRHADELVDADPGETAAARELLEEALEGALAERLAAVKRGEPDLRTDEGFEALVEMVEQRVPGARAVLEQNRDRLVESFEGMASRKATNDALVAIDEILADPDGHLTERVIAATDLVRRREKRTDSVSAADPAFGADAAAARRWRPLAMTLGEDDFDPDAETAGEFIARVREVAKERGYRVPGYVEHVPRATLRSPFSVHAIGGTRSVAGTKPWTGSLFRVGRQNLDPKVVTHAFARNVKRYFNWNLVARTVDRHGFEWSKGMTPRQILDEIDRRNLVEDDIVIWNAGRFYSAFARADADEGGRLESGNLAPFRAERREEVDTAYDETARAGMTVAELRDGLRDNPRDFTEPGNYVAIPKAVYEQVHATIRPDTAAARAWETFFKGVPSQIILGLGNLAWLQFQVASNALLYGLAAGPVGLAKLPLTAVQTHRWWKGLSDREREAIEPYIGVGHFHQDFDRRHIGGAANNGLVRAFRVMEQSYLWRSVNDGFKRRGRTVFPPVNPIRALFRLDEMQNNFWRRTLMYDQAKKAAFRDMSRHMGEAYTLERKLVAMLKGPPDQVVKRLLSNRADLERHAAKVNEFLGDYLRFTDFERRWLQRNVMFYGFLRFSLRFTFYTMPVGHPLQASILMQVGNLGREEVERLLGGHTLPWALGRYFFKKNGELHSVDLARANPMLNQLVAMTGPNQIPGMFSPFIAAAANQVAEKDLFTGDAWKVEGETTGRPEEVGYGFEERSRILADDLLSMAAPYRIAKESGAKGPEGDDSLLWNRRPTRYVDEETVKSIRRGERDRPRGVDHVVAQLFPWVGKPDTTPEQAKRRAKRKREYEEGQRNRGKDRGGGWSGSGGDWSGDGGWD